MHTSGGLRLRLLWLNSWRIYVLTPKRFEAPSKWAPRRRRHQSRLGCFGCIRLIVRPSLYCCCCFSCCCGAVAGHGAYVLWKFPPFCLPPFSACDFCCNCCNCNRFPHHSELRLARQQRFDVLGSCEVLANLPAGASCRLRCCAAKQALTTRMRIVLALLCCMQHKQYWRNATIVEPSRSGDSRTAVWDWVRYIVNYRAVFSCHLFTFS